MKMLIAALLLILCWIGAQGQVHPEPEIEKEARDIGRDIKIGTIVSKNGWSIEFLKPPFGPLIRWNGSQELMDKLHEEWLEGMIKISCNTSYGQCKYMAPDYDWSVPKSDRIEDKIQFYGKSWRRLDLDFARELDIAFYFQLWNTEQGWQTVDKRISALISQVTGPYYAARKAEEEQRQKQYAAQLAVYSESVRQQSLNQLNVPDN